MSHNANAETDAKARSEVVADESGNRVPEFMRGLPTDVGVLELPKASQARFPPWSPVSRLCQIMLNVCKSRRIDDCERRSEISVSYELAVLRNS